MHTPKLPQHMFDAKSDEDADEEVIRIVVMLSNLTKIGAANFIDEQFTHEFMTGLPTNLRRKLAFALIEFSKIQLNSQQSRLQQFL
jgi:hypothetical protein